MKELKCQHPNHKHRCYGDNIYNKVGNEKRLTLLNLVKIQGKSLKDAASMLNINYSTAKTILRVYRIENRILKKSPNQKRLRRVERNRENASEPLTSKSFNDSIGSIKNSNESFSPFSDNKLEGTSIDNNSTHNSDDFYQYTEKFLGQFLSILNSLQSSISQVVENEHTIKNIYHLLKKCGNINSNNNYNNDYYPSYPSNPSINSPYCYMNQRNPQINVQYVPATYNEALSFQIPTNINNKMVIEQNE